jgi:hypothetical protein
LVWRNRKKISQIIKDYFYLPFFLLIILWLLRTDIEKDGAVRTISHQCSLQDKPYRLPEFQTLKEPKNKFQGTNSAKLCSLAGLYDNPIPTRFLAPIDYLKIPAQDRLQHREDDISFQRFDITLE